MSDTTLLFVLTLLIFASGGLLTMGWHKYLVSRRKQKNSRNAH